MKIRNIIFDWKRTLYDPDKRELIDGVAEVLAYLKQSGLPLYLVGKGDEDMRGEVRRLGAEAFFKDMDFVAGGKQPEHFERFVDAQQPASTLIVGDRVRSEIAVGNRLGATTIQVRQGKFAAELADHPDQRPDHIVADLHELLTWLKGKIGG